MNMYTRRDLLGGIVGAVGVLAGCSENEPSSSGAFTETKVEDQQLIVEFKESLEAESISAIDPTGEVFAEASVAAGASRVTFDIGMPYTPGEYHIVAADDGDTVAETTQEIQPDLEVIDVGIGANRMDEMPEERGQARSAEALVTIENTGTGPETLSELAFTGDIPNPSDLDNESIGIYDPEIPGEVFEPVDLNSDQKKTIFSSTLPFLFEGDGIDCSSEPQTGEMKIHLIGEIHGEYSEQYRLEYTSSESYDSCEISLEGGI